MVPTLFASYSTLSSFPTSSSSSYFPSSYFSTSFSVYAPMQLCLLCPLFFSVAHLHHAYEHWRNGIPWIKVLIELTVQATFTYIFGYIACIFFVRTGSIASCITSHVICNYMGLPDVSFMRAQGGDYQMLYAWRYILLLLHGLGLSLFFYLLFPLTESLAQDSIYYSSQ